jgi:hypothetical protein
MRRSPVSHESTSETAGPPILISFTELRGIHTKLAEVATRLEHFQLLPGEVDKLDTRLTSLETDKAVRDDRSGFYGKLLGGGAATFLVIIGAVVGAWLQAWLQPFFTH